MAALLGEAFGEKKQMAVKTAESRRGLNREPLDGSSLVASSPEFSEGLTGAPVCRAPWVAGLEAGSEGVRRRSTSSC